ncbi:DUF3043 domain-containing protein [Georgenia halophila]|uniref:DUF3043 domain-containing protein n=1 Tax=Georgenia halophila TaxID=620889 RepID=A0ABP8LNE3_9MICO
MDEPEPTVETAGRKGRPTPKRREQEAKNRRPLVQDDRKEAKRIQRERRNEAWQRQRRAMATGEERYLPVRDKGRARRYARDYVDARWCIAELFMPVAMLMIIAMLFVGLYPQMANVIVFGTYALLLVAIIDTLILVTMLQRRLKKKFGEDEIPRFTGLYAFTRAFYLRRMRQPKPQVKRGQFPS